MDDKLVTDVCQCESCRSKDASPNRTGGGIMNVREALEEVLRDHVGRYAQSDSIHLAPIIERALRAAGGCGEVAGKHGVTRPDDYIRAGVVAMMEES